MTRERRQSDEQDLVFVVLLALDATGHGLAFGSINDLATMASHEALDTMREAGWIRADDDGVLLLTDGGRLIARDVACRLGEARR